MISSAVDGKIAQLKRENETGIRHARWAGYFAQVALKEHEQALKQLLGVKAERKAMSGAEISKMMRAFAGRVS
jgi:hypothetical protein